MNYTQDDVVKFYKKLGEFREAEKYTDITIECEDRSFKCHRLVLSMASDYFDVMFGGCFKEGIQQNVVIQEVDAGILEQVLNFIYTGRVEINSSNICRLLKASNYFSLTSMEDVCIKFLENMKETTVQSVLDIFSFALAIKKDILIEIMNRYIAKHFHIFSEISAFLEIPYDALDGILNEYSKSATRNEELLLGAICRWICHARGERAKDIDCLTAKVRLENIPVSYIRSIMSILAKVDDAPMVTGAIPKSEGETILRIQDDNALHIIIRYNGENLMRVFSVNNTGHCALTKSGIPIVNHRKEFRQIVATMNETHMYCLKGDDTSAKQFFSAYTSVDMHCEVKLTSPPLVFRSIFLSGIQNNIYAYTDYCEEPPVLYLRNTSCPAIFTNEELTRRIYMYNCDVNNWYPVPPMKKLLNLSSLTACNDILYLIGGCDDEEETPNGYAQAYDIRSNGWQKLPKTKHSYCSAATCSLDGKVYVCGGLDDNYSAQKCAERYDPIAGKWEVIPNLNEGCGLDRAVPYLDKVWAMGSSFFSSVASQKNPLIIEIFDPKLNQWSTSSILIEAAMKTTSPSSLFDMVVFKPV